MAGEYLHIFRSLSQFRNLLQKFTQTSHLNTNEMQFLSLLFGVRTVHVSEVP